MKKTRRITSIILMIALVATMFSMAAFSASAAYDYANINGEEYAVGSTVTLSAKAKSEQVGDVAAFSALIPFGDGTVIAPSTEDPDEMINLVGLNLADGVDKDSVLIAAAIWTNEEDLSIPVGEKAVYVSVTYFEGPVVSGDTVFTFPFDVVGATEPDEEFDLGVKFVEVSDDEQEDVVFVDEDREDVIAPVVKPVQILKEFDYNPDDLPGRQVFEFDFAPTSDPAKHYAIDNGDPYANVAITFTTTDYANSVSEKPFEIQLNKFTTYLKNAPADPSIVYTYTVKEKLAGQTVNDIKYDDAEYIVEVIKDSHGVHVFAYNSEDPTKKVNDLDFLNEDVYTPPTGVLSATTAPFMVVMIAAAGLVVLYMVKRRRASAK